MSINTIDRISYPLSPTQEGMLFDRLFGQQAGVHIEQIHCTLHEALDVAAFHEAWLRFVSRHDVLRTTFRWEGLDGPVQDVHSEITVPLEQHDWRHLSEPEQLGRGADLPPQGPRKRLRPHTATTASSGAIPFGRDALSTGMDVLSWSS